MTRVGNLSNVSVGVSSDGGCGGKTKTSSNLYWIQPVADLPTVDLSITIASRLLSRPHWTTGDLRAFNTRQILFLERWLFRLQLLALWSFPSALSVFFLRDPTLRTIASVVAFTSSMPLSTLGFVSFSWDMTKLIFRTFEFWFLTSVNVVNTAVLFSLFRDIRIIVVVSTSIFYQLTLFADANLHTRLVELRFLVFSPPAMIVVVLACVFRITPDLHYATLNIFGTAIDDIDLLMNGNIIIAFFTSFKTHRNRHLLSSKHASERHIVQCQMYFPMCRLAATTQPKLQLLRRSTVQVNNAFAQRKSSANRIAIGYEQTLHMVPSGIADAVAVERTLGGSLAKALLSIDSNWFWPMALNLLSIVGIVCAILTHVACMLRLNLGPLLTSSSEIPVELTGLVATIGFTVTYAACYQRDLLRMLLREVDTWFSAVHFTVVTVCLADILHWDHRVLPVLTAWLWSLWIILLDAVPPSTRRQLAFQRSFLLLVNLLLMLFHVSLLHALFFASSPTDSAMRNRVLLDLTVGPVRVRLEMFSFVASKIFTSFVWMGRFFWREMWRPRDAFKLVKHRVQFLIPSE